MDVNIRPYTKIFIKNMSNLFDLGIFTAAQESYAQEVIKQLDPKGKFIKVLLSRNHCAEIEPNVFVKDLSIIGNRPHNKILIVDNFAHSYALQMDNGIPCIPFYDDPEDSELFKLDQYLRILSSSDDPIKYNREYFQNHVMLDESKLQDAISMIFGKESTV